MASYTAIADASETLVELMRDQITARRDVVTVDRTEIALVSPADVSADSDVRLSLYLYAVTENSVMKNATPRDVGTDSRRDPPLTLDLQYLLTAFPSQGGNVDTTTSIDQQRLLGLAMQVFHDNAIIDGDALQGSLAESDTDLHVSLEPEPTTDLANLWNTLGETPLHPSVTYHVSPVAIDSTVTRPVSRVQKREAEVEQRDRDDAIDHRQFDANDAGE